MRNPFHGARFAGLSIACTIAGYVLYWMYVRTGTYYRLGYPVVNIGKFAVLCPCLIGVILALASVIWNPRKMPGVVALAIGIAGTWVLWAMGG